MKPKKTNKANLENKRGIFLQIGLLISLSLLIAAFEWSSIPNNEGLKAGIDILSIDEEYAVITREDIPKPPPPVLKIPDVLNIVEELDPLKDEYTGVEAEPEPGMMIAIIDMPPEPEVIETLPSYAVNELPDFQGDGLEGFRVWVLKNLRYPEMAAENGISGKVILQLTVNHRGKVQDIIILRGVDPALDQEAIRVVSTSPTWIPGKRGIKTVNVILTMPISFVLQ